MLKSLPRKLFTTSRYHINLIRNIVNIGSQFSIEKPHIYSRTWTKNELIQYLKDNIVYKTDDYVVTSVPQGIALKKKKSEWADSNSGLVCDADLEEIMQELPITFKSEMVFLTKYPKRNASGLIIFSKSFKAHKYLMSNFTLFSSRNTLIYKYLVVVLGCPVQTLSQTFVVQSVKIGDRFCTEVLEKWNDSKKIKKIFYQHEVIASSEFVSLIKVEVSNDRRDCVRHILATKCLTPVLGDSWNYIKKNSILFDIPLAVDPSVLKDPMKLDPELLAKLQLKSGGEKIIPIHVHLQSIKLPLKKCETLVVSAPPPESFVWTCHQLELHEIKYFRRQY